jgi:hypothetical protein
VRASVFPAAPRMRGLCSSDMMNRRFDGMVHAASDVDGPIGDKVKIRYRVVSARLQKR